MFCVLLRRHKGILKSMKLIESKCKKKRNASFCHFLNAKETEIFRAKEKEKISAT